MPTVTRLTSNGVFQSSGGFDEVSLNSGSIWFDGTGTGNSLTYTSGSTLAFGTGDFTVEAWVYSTITITSNKVMDTRTTGVAGWYFGFGMTISGYLGFSNNGTNFEANAGTVANTWYHIAYTRSGTTGKLFCNGVLVGTFTDSTTYTTSTTATIGNRYTATAGYQWGGYISNLRVVNGTAVYTANFTPPGAPLTAIANTSLLLSTNPQNPFKDSSSNNFTITKNGTPTFNTLGPFYYPANTSINLTNTNNTPNIGSNTNIITSTTSNGVVMSSGGFDEITYNPTTLGPNLITFPIDFTNAIWTRGPSTTVTSNTAVAPDGTLTATRYQVPVGSGTYLYITRTLTAGVNYTFSIYTRTDSALPNFNIAFDTNFPIGAGTYSATANVVSNSTWTRYSVSYTPPTTASYSIGLDNIVNGIATDVNIWGAQLQVGPTLTDYKGNLTETLSLRKQDANTGTTYITGEFDEWTGVRVFDSNLVLWLDAGQQASYPRTGTTWYDISGNGNNGKLINGPTYDSANGGSIVFDAVDDYFNGSFSCDKTYYSVDFWCYPTQLINYNWNIGFNNLWGDFNMHTTSTGGVYVGTSVGSRIGPWRNDVFVLNTWHNFTWTFNNGAARFYKNGILEVTSTLALSASPSFTTYSSGNTGNFCTGKLANFKVYSGKVLTDNEISTNFNALRGQYGI